MDDAPAVLVDPQPFVLVVEPHQEAAAMVADGFQGPPGPPGKSGTGIALISADAGNQLTEGTDEGLFVPEPSGTDFLALYQLARG